RDLGPDLVWDRPVLPFHSIEELHEQETCQGVACRCVQESALATPTKTFRQLRIQVRVQADRPLDDRRGRSGRKVSESQFGGRGPTFVTRLSATWPYAFDGTPTRWGSL